MLAKSVKTTTNQPTGGDAADGLAKSFFSGKCTGSNVWLRNSRPRALRLTVAERGGSPIHSTTELTSTLGFDYSRSITSPSAFGAPFANAVFGVLDFALDRMRFHYVSMADLNRLADDVVSCSAAPLRE